MRMEIPESLSHFLESNSETWEKQESFSKLNTFSKPRGIEIFYPNEYYGLDLIVKAFIGIDPEISLVIGIPHGMELGDDGVGNNFGNGTNLSSYIYYNQIGLKNMEARSIKGWKIPAEHPLLLLISILKNLDLLKKKPLKNATLFFPAHRDEAFDFVNKDYDYEVCRALSAGFSKSKQIDVSLQISDISLGRHLIYQKHGFRVVSSGHRFDPRFLSRFVNLVTSYEQVASSEIGSHLFYTAAIGSSTVFWDIGLDRLQVPDTQRRKENPFTLDSSIDSLFQAGHYFNQQTAEKWLGGGEKPVSKAYWSEIHHDAIKHDRFGLLQPVGQTKKLVIPGVLRRPLVKINKKILLRQ